MKYNERICQEVTENCWEIVRNCVKKCDVPEYRVNFDGSVTFFNVTVHSNNIYLAM